MKISATRTPFYEWLARWTTLPELAQRWFGAPPAGFSAWARTTAGVVALLLSVQLFTGVLLAFHYVPATDSAYITVAYLEKVVGAGSWLRSLHYHASQWLPAALILHLAQMLGRRAYLSSPVAWLTSLVLLGLVLGAATTGYALPWDARALNGASIGAGIAGGLPLAGALARRWVLNGDALSTLTLSRFYALHVFVTPTLLLLCVAARLFLFREPPPENESAAPVPQNWQSAQMTRQAVVFSAVFVALALVSLKWPAPLGPTAQAAGVYIPRPGPQFLWLFEMLKYLPERISSVVALAFPGLLLGALAALALRARSTHRDGPRRALLVCFAGGFALISALTALAVWQDARDPRTREQLARQEREEAEWRAQPFQPQQHSAVTEKAAPIAEADKPATTAITNAPPIYIMLCAKCHGAQGEGQAKYPPVRGLTTRAETRRTVEDLIGIINDPPAYGLAPVMKSFADKMTEKEKRATAEWLASLK